jgi:hypothetical protein
VEEKKRRTFMQTRIATLISALLVVLTFAIGSVAQRPQKPLTNDDVIAMVHKKLPESVIVSAIQAGPSKFNASPDELIRLNAAGVTENELNAIVSASGKAGTVSAPATAGAKSEDTAGTMPGSKSRMPRLVVTQGNSSQELKLEKTQLAETKTKPSSMKALATDSAVTQAMQAGVSTASYSAAMHMNSGVGGAASRRHFLRHHVASDADSHVRLGSSESCVEQCSANDEAKLHGGLLSHHRGQF